MSGSGFSSEIGLLGSDLLGTGLVHFLLRGEGLSAGLISGSGNLTGLLVHFALLVVEPCLKLVVGLLLGEGALFNAVEEVVVVHHAFVFEDGACSMRHLGTDLQPVQGAIVDHVNGGGVGVGIVGADFLDETTVALGAGIGGDNVVEGLSFLTVALETEACGHVKNVLKGSETQLLILKIGPRR